MVTLTINGKDAQTEYGAWLGEDSLAALITPAPNKSYLENKSAIANGKDVLISSALPAVQDERNVKLIFYIRGTDTEAMMEKYDKFCTMLQDGKVDISTSFRPNVTYHLYYLSCGEPKTAFQTAIRLTVNFNEPDPTNRT